MRIVVIGDSGDFAGSVNTVRDIVSNPQSSRDSFVLVCVVEPSNVVDQALSLYGQTKYRDIVEDRLKLAQASVDALTPSILLPFGNGTRMANQAVLGDFVEVALKAAAELQADLLVICNPNERNARKLIDKAPCSVEFFKKRNRKAS